MSKVSSCITRFTKRNWYPIISVSGNYTTIKKDGELVVLHPSISKVTLFKRVGVPSDHRFELKDIHSTRCRCTKCDALHVELAQSMKDLNKPTYVSHSDKDEDDVYKMVKRFQKAGFNIAGVVNKNDPEEVKTMFKDICNNLDKENGNEN